MFTGVVAPTYTLFNKLTLLDVVASIQYALALFTRKVQPEITNVSKGEFCKTIAWAELLP